MSHYITAKQLAGQYKHLLASSSEDNKKLWVIITITCHRFHTDEKMSFVIEHKGIVVHISNYISLAIKAYNEIQGQTFGTPEEWDYHKRFKNTPFTKSVSKSSICMQCNKQDHCNAYLRNPERFTRTCVSFEQLK
jgi:hypothetical protein